MVKLLFGLIGLILLAGCRSGGGSGESLDSAISPDINARGSQSSDVRSMVAGDPRNNTNPAELPRTSPEPSTLILIGTGLAGIAASVLKKKRKA